MSTQTQEHRCLLLRSFTEQQSGIQAYLVLNYTMCRTMAIQCGNLAHEGKLLCAGDWSNRDESGIIAYSWQMRRNTANCVSPDSSLTAHYSNCVPWYGTGCTQSHSFLWARTWTKTSLKAVLSQSMLTHYKHHKVVFLSSGWSHPVTVEITS